MSEPTVPPPPSYNPPPPPPPPSMGGTPGSVSPNRTVMIVLSYLGILALIPLIVEKDDKEVQWHAKHGLVFLVAEIAASIIIGIVGFVLPDLGCTGCILQSALLVAILVLHVTAIMKGINGQRLIIPGLSEYVNRF